MKAVEITEFGPPEVLQLTERPMPVAGPREVVVRVAAAGVNRPDVIQRLGKYPPPPGASDIPGLEVSGTIAEVGPDVLGWRVGDRVCALVSGGGYAEYCLVPSPQLLSVPAGLSDVEAAAVPETFFTVWTNLFERGRLQRGESVLIHGGTSGIGTTAIQLARASGARVFATAGSAEKCAACVRLGAEHAADYRTDDWVAEFKDRTAGAGVDVVLDMVGGDYVPRNLDLLAVEGRLIQIAFLKSPRVELDLSVVMRKRLTVTGSTLRPRSPEEKGAIARGLHAAVWPWLADRTVAPIVHAVLPLADAAAAHRIMEASTHIGKIVLQVA